MRVAIVCSAHGFGHVTRQLEVARRLPALGCTPVLLTAAPLELVHGWVPGVEHHPYVADVGLVQSDSITEDIPATALRLAERCAEPAIDRLADTLRALDVACVVADTPPMALEAARRAGLPALAVGNFSWPWIYGHYPQLRGWAARLARWQAPHPAVELWPGPGMLGFARVKQLGLLGRHAPGQTRRPGGVLVSFGGFGLHDLADRLPTLPGVTWLTAPPMPALGRPDSQQVVGRSYPALVAEADVVVTKPGYGILAEAALAGTRVVWVPRGPFPEADAITAVLRARGDRPVDIHPGATPAQWRIALAEAVSARLADPPPPPATNDSARVAQWISQWAADPARHR